METSPVTQKKSEELARQATERQAFIDRIKEEVSKPVDNLTKPVPLFSQLHTMQ